MTDFDPSKPHDLTSIKLPTTNYWLGGMGINVGQSYTAGGELNGVVTRIRMMPAGYILLTINQTQGPQEQIGKDAFALLWGNGMITEVRREEPVPELVAPTNAQEKARERVAKAVQQ
jgi:hypothetical protein